MKRKICVVVTARPSYSRIRTALRAIHEHPDLELQLVVAASALLDRYGSAIQTIERDGFPIAARVYMVVEGENVIVGKPIITGAKIEATVVAQVKGPKVVSFKYTPKKRFRQKKGHRQQYTRVRIDSIVME